MTALSRKEFLYLLDHAACGGAPAYLFDAKEYPEAYDALAYCARCPVSGLCLRNTNPIRTYFDGVAGGSVWVNGAWVDPLTGKHIGRDETRKQKPHERSTP